jgi:hypothetical protein
MNTALFVHVPGLILAFIFGTAYIIDAVIPVNVDGWVIERFPKITLPLDHIAPKFMLTVLVFEMKDGKNEQKVKKILTVIYHYLLEGDKPKGQWPKATCVGAYSPENV